MPMATSPPRSDSYLFQPENIPTRAAFPAIDAPKKGQS